MDNFNLRAFLAKNPLNEAMSPQDVVDIADTVAEEFTKESAEKGDFLVYSVGRMEADDMSFELDTDLTSQSPKDIDTRGVGEGWGGIFRIKPTEDGYEVRNAEKGGLVAMIDGAGNFRMLSADESRAEMGMEEGPVYPEDKHLMTPDEFGDDEIDMDRYNDELDMDRYNDELDMKRMEEAEEAPKSNKMKKSELKEMIKAAMLAETSVEETLVDADQDMADAILNALGGEAAFEALVRAMSTDDAQTYLGAIMRDHDIEMGPVDDIPGFEGTMDALNKLGLEEAEEEEVADEVEVDAEETEDVEVADADMEGDIDIDVEAEAEISPEVKATQDALTAAIEAAKALGDQKLADQIGNSITFFTRTHVVGQDKVAETVDIFSERMLKNAGIKK